MSYALGIDVGTTFTAAAMWRDGRVEVLALETHRVTVPSVVFADGDDLLFGAAAGARGVAQPAGMAREFKRRLGDSVPIMLSGAPYSADRLVALFVRWVVDSVSEQLGERPASVVVTHPANWTEFQLHLLTSALDNVGLGGVGMLSEPQAAAHDFGTAAQLGTGELVLVYDLGGGTFDVALLRRDDVGFSHVGESAGVERLGGIDFDEAVFQYVVGRIPADVVAGARDDGAGRMALGQLRRACVEAKESLSSEVAVELPVVLPGHSSTVRLTRAEFEDMIRPMLRQTIELSQQVLTSAGISPEGLSAILLVGGSSRIPMISELVRQEMGAQVRVDAHPKLVVARGAGRWAGEQTPAVRRTTTSRTPRNWKPVAAIVGALAVVAAAAAGFVLLGDDGDEANGTTPTAEPTAGPTADPTTPETGNGDTTAPSVPQQSGATTMVVGSEAAGTFAVATADGDIRLYEAATGEEVDELIGHSGPVGVLFFSPDGSRLASGSEDGTARLWDLASGDDIPLTGHEGAVQMVRWAPDAAQVATGGADGTVRTWDAETGDPQLSFGAPGAPVTFMAFSSAYDSSQPSDPGDDQPNLAVLRDDGTVGVWDASTGDRVYTLRGHNGPITDVTWSRSGDRLATSSEDGTVILWDAATGERVSTLGGHTGPVTDNTWLRFGPDTRLATAGDDGMVLIWDTPAEETEREFGPVGSEILTMGIAPDHPRLAAADADGIVHVWDVDTGETVSEFEGHDDGAIPMAWIGETLATVEDGRVLVWDTDDGTELFEL